LPLPGVVNATFKRFESSLNRTSGNVVPAADTDKTFFIGFSPTCAHVPRLQARYERKENSAHDLFTRLSALWNPCGELPRRAVRSITRLRRASARIRQRRFSLPQVAHHRYL